MLHIISSDVNAMNLKPVCLLISPLTSYKTINKINPCILPTILGCTFQLQSSRIDALFIKSNLVKSIPSLP